MARRRPRHAAALLVAGIGALAGVGGASAGLRDLTVDRGIVQSVSPLQIVLRELDGDTVAIAVDRRARVRVNGMPARLADVRPGFVAAVAHEGEAPARAVRAVGRVGVTRDAGIVVSVSPTLLVLRRGDGSALTVRLTATTRVRWKGLPATVAAIRPGRLARVVQTPSGTARRVEVFRRRLG